MIEFAMVFAVGFLAASLLGLLVAPLVARRAKRAALLDWQRRMPVSMNEVAAERDAQRAVHAVALRRLEQRAEASATRWAESRAEAGRQIARIVTLDGRHTADRATIQTLETALDEARQAMRVAEATVSQQAIALGETTATADRRQVLLDASTARVSAVEAMIAGQRDLLQELEGRLASHPRETVTQPREAAPPPPAEVGNDVQASGAVSRLRAEQDLTRKALSAATGERDRLRLRVDELLLTIEDRDDKAEETAERVADRERHAVRQAKAIETLTARLRTRDEAITALRQRMVEAETATSRPRPTDAAALRQEIARLAADLVGFATASREAGDAPLGLDQGIVSDPPAAKHDG